MLLCLLLDVTDLLRELLQGILEVAVLLLKLWAWRCGVSITAGSGAEDQAYPAASLGPPAFGSTWWLVARSGKTMVEERCGAVVREFGLSDGDNRV